ncbi:MAG: SulP family inorganic anion transporter [Gammaproteobacteria bacterium]
MRRFANYFPIVQWGREYDKDSLSRDILAAVIVTIMLIPQSLAYALLAGLPAKVGLYASILPLIVYAIFGTSKTLSVGPVAVASLMTASALSEIAQQGTTDYLTAAIMLALISGVFLLVLGFFKLGFLANFLSHPVVSGFITASGILIAFSQLKHVLGVSAHGETLLEIGSSLASQLVSINYYTLMISVAVLYFLYWARCGFAKILMSRGFAKKKALLFARAAPVISILATIFIVYFLNLESKSVALVGAIPAGLPSLQIPDISMDLIKPLFLPAVLISIIGYVESISVGKTLAAKKRQKIDVNQELVGLGAANVASAVSGAFPVTGGFSRSVVNFDAGAATQAASIFAAIGIALASLFLTPALYYLPKATLAATIIIAVLSLVDFSIFKKTWNFSRSDFYAVFTTVVLTLLFGVEAGVACGVGTSIALHLYRTSMPHIAEVGLVEGTEHFRNINRYHVVTKPEVFSLRMDESLFFANASYLEDKIHDAIYYRDKIAHVVLMCSAINEIDLSAMEMLEAVNERLIEQGIHLHLSEIKGPVMETLERSGFLDELSGKIFLTQFEAYSYLNESK